MVLNTYCANNPEACNSVDVSRRYEMNVHPTCTTMNLYNNIRTIYLEMQEETSSSSQS